MAPWEMTQMLAQQLGIGASHVLPIWGLDTLFAGQADVYIWPPANQRFAIVAWLTEHGCDWRMHPDDSLVIVVRGADVAAALTPHRGEH